jgi:hypothetical protein
MTQHIVKIAPRGNYVIIGGDKADRNAILIHNGQHKIIDPLIKLGAITLLYDVYADWTADDGYYEISRFLDLSNVIPEAIVSANDGLATGVIRALTERGLAGKVAVTGLDGFSTDCKWNTGSNHFQIFTIRSIYSSRNGLSTCQWQKSREAQQQNIQRKSRSAHISNKSGFGNQGKFKTSYCQ